jgi:hypothetical protein
MTPLTKTDPLTGLPEVPEGYFWQVKKAGIDDWLRLYLKKKLFWGLSCEVEWTVVQPPFTPETFYDEALHILEEWDPKMKKQADEDQGRAYLGKYPPKNIKDVAK